MSEPKTRKTQPAKYRLVYAADLANVSEDAEDTGPEERTWLYQLDPPIADRLLVSLRQILTITYRQDDAEDAYSRKLEDIRKLAAKALGPLDSILRALRQKPLHADLPQNELPQIYKFVIASDRDLQRKVLLEDPRTKARFIGLIESAPADPLFIALRRIVSLTFFEVFGRKDQKKPLWQIRHTAAEALVPVNALLEQIEIEPAAIPTLEFDADEDAEMSVDKGTAWRQCCVRGDPATSLIRGDFNSVVFQGETIAIKKVNRLIAGMASHRRV